MRYKFVLAILAVGGSTLLAQNASVKMGLWEKTIVSSGAQGAPATVTAQSCITPEAWRRMLANAQKPHDGCKMNMVPNPKGYNFSGTCIAGQGATITIQGSQTIQDPEHIVSESHSVSTRGGKTRTIDVHSTSRFLSSNCGAVKPDGPEGN